MQRKEIQQAAQAVMERLKTMPRPDWEGQALKQAQTEQARKRIGLFPRDFGMEPWDWPQGVGLYGMYKFGQATNDETCLAYIRDWFDRHLNGDLPRRNINTTCPLLTLAELADEDPRYYSLCDDWADWLMKEQPRTEEGGFQHTTTRDAAAGTLNLNENQIWIDTLFMTVLFLAKWGVRTRNRAMCAEAEHQFLLMIQYLYCRQTGLFYHAWTFSGRNNFGNVFWCRGNSWYTAAAMDFVQLLGEQMDPAVKAILINTYLAQVNALRKCQSDTGLWHTVLDDPASYTETSGSAAIAYGLLRGIEAGVLDQSWRPCAEKALEGIVKNIGPDGVVQGVSAGTPVGKDADSYKNIRIAPMAYGQSLSLMALAEMLRA